MAPYTVHKSLDQGLYFLDGQRKTIEKPKYSREFDVFEPRIGKVVAKCPIAPKELVDRVCTDAKKAQPAWGKIVPMERAKVLLKVADIIRVKTFLL
uniref:Aldedh domain-containing protein n=1 Tax=Bursaphelenchus xylophilus TaxID=6326 RepID=A0A1I7S223_BURXY